MGNPFSEIAFPPAVLAQQEAYGSRNSYRRALEGDVRNDRLTPTAFTVNYQSHGDGGCANTTSLRDGGGGVRQRTNTERLIPQGASL